MDLCPFALALAKYYIRDEATTECGEGGLSRVTLTWGIKIDEDVILVE
jgi:hypothetical protein